MQNKLDKEIKDIQLWATNSKESFEAISMDVDSYWKIKQDNYVYCKRYDFESLAELREMIDEASMHSEINEIMKCIHISIMKSREIRRTDSNVNDDMKMPDYIYVMQ